MTVLFCYLGVHEEIVQRTLAKLANWPSFAPADLDVLLQETLAHVAEILGAPRVVLVCEEMEEPWLLVAEWDREVFRFTRESPDAFGTVVDDLHINLYFKT